MHNEFRILIEVPDYSSSYLFFFRKMKRKPSPPEENKYLGTTKRSTRIILVHVQKMYKTYYLGTRKESTRMILVHVRITVVAFFFQKMKRKPSPPEEKNI